jgi:hypothetical protein
VSMKLVRFIKMKRIVKRVEVNIGLVIFLSRTG